MELAVWPNSFGLPSFDSKCLTVMAFCKFNKFPVTFIKTGNPWKSPTGELPVLKNDRKKVPGVQEIVDYLCKDQLETLTSLTRQQNSTAVALVAMMEEKLSLALEHYQWVDSKNFSEFTRPWFAKAMIFPLSLFLPVRINKGVTNKLFLCKGNKFLTDKDKEYKIYKDAKECMNLLSSALGGNEYFFGQNPTYFDAVIFGYLAPLLKAPFPNQSLQQHLKACTNLTLFCQRILDKFFPLSKEELEEMAKAEEKQAEERKTTDTEFPHRTRNKVLAGVLALSAMVFYAFVSGMVVIQITEDEGENESNEVNRAYHTEMPNFGDQKKNDEQKN